MLMDYLTTIKGSYSVFPYNCGFRGCLPSFIEFRKLGHTSTRATIILTYSVIACIWVLGNRRWYVGIGTFYLEKTKKREFPNSEEEGFAVC